MCSTPPATTTSYAPNAMPAAVVVTAVIAPAHIRSIAYPGVETGSPARRAAVRPMVSPWSPICVVAAMATSSMRSGDRLGVRRMSSLMHLITRSSARVSAYRPVGPAFPKGVLTPSTKTTSLTVRGTGSPPLVAETNPDATHEKKERKHGHPHPLDKPQRDSSVLAGLAGPQTYQCPRHD